MYKFETRRSNLNEFYMWRAFRALWDDNPEGKQAGKAVFAWFGDPDTDNRLNSRAPDQVQQTLLPKWRKCYRPVSARHSSRRCWAPRSPASFPRRSGLAERCSALMR
jgi:hypothetical protein